MIDLSRETIFVDGPFSIICKPNAAFIEVPVANVCIHGHIIDELLTYNCLFFFFVFFCFCASFNAVVRGLTKTGIKAAGWLAIVPS